MKQPAKPKVRRIRSDAEALGKPPRDRKKAAQPLGVVAIDGALLAAATVMALLGVSHSTLYRLARVGELVPIKRSVRCTRWVAQDVRAYLAKIGAGAGHATA